MVLDYRVDDIFNNYDELIPRRQSEGFYKNISTRRSTRAFTEQVPDIEVIKNAILAAGTAPNGANKQPWHFAVIKDKVMKRKIRAAAEEVEAQFYSDIKNNNQTWLQDLKPFRTNHHKPYLESGAFLIVISAKLKEENAFGDLTPTYYPIESTCIAAGIMITALHTSGLATLTHTPKPMRFLNELLELPAYYRPLILLVAGYPDTSVPLLQIPKKKLDEIADFY